MPIKLSVLDTSPIVAGSPAKQALHKTLELGRCIRTYIYVQHLRPTGLRDTSPARARGEVFNLLAESTNAATPCCPGSARPCSVHCGRESTFDTAEVDVPPSSPNPVPAFLFPLHPTVPLGRHSLQNLQCG